MMRYRSRVTTFKACGLLCIGLWSSSLPSFAAPATAISPTGGTGSPASLGTVVGQGGVATNLCTAACVITGGTRAGGNLFHSLGTLNIAAGDSAIFQNTIANPVADLGVANILARITAGQSSIYGNINSATYYPAANLFLVNPAGFLFGPNATVNVGGMVAFSSADYLRFTDGGRFNAVPDPIADAILSPSPVAAFGFLGTNPGAITVQGSQFVVSEGQSISLVGGTIAIGADADSGTPANFSAASGHINLASVASAGEVTVGEFLPTSGMTMAHVSLSQGTTLDVSGDPGGTVRIRSGRLEMDQSYIFAGSFGDIDGATTAVSIKASGDMLVRNQSIIDATGSGAGRTGHIEIEARSLRLTDGSMITNQGFGSAPAGNINLKIDQSFVMEGMDPFGNGSLMQTINTGIGTGGAITIAPLNPSAPPVVTLADGAKILTMAGGQSAAGDITLQPAGLTLRSGASIQTLGSDDASSGSIHVNATDDVALIGQGDFTTRILNQNSGPGGTGSIKIEAGNLSLIDKAQILSETTSLPGSSLPTDPKVSIKATDSVTVTGGSRIDLSNNASPVGSLDLHATNTVTVSDLGLISTSTIGSGDAGAINIRAGAVSMTGGGQINSLTQGTAASGKGGAISILADGTIALSGTGINSLGELTPTGIQSGSLFNSTGQGGSITLKSNQTQIMDGAVVSAQTTGSGAAGNITIEGNASPAHSVLIDGAGSGIFTETQGSGAGGNITTWSNQLQLTNGSTISSKTSGSGNAGNILVRADDIAISSGATVTAASTGSGNAGSVTIQGTASPANSFLVDGIGSGVLTDTSLTGAGGDILVNANAVTLSNGGMLSATTSGTEPTATGGNITVNADSFHMNGAAGISAGTFSETSGDAGNILISARTIQTEGLSTLSTVSVGTGRAGNITLRGTDQIALVDTFINSDAASYPNPSAGDGGNIHLVSPMASLQGSILSTSSFGAGKAGDITLEVAHLNISSGLRGTEIATAAQGQGHAGDITIHGLGSQTFADEVTISAGVLRSETFGVDPNSGDAGNIVIQANKVNLSDASLLTTRTTSDGKAGNIQVFSTDSFSMSGLSVIDSSSVSASAVVGNAGQVLITAPSISMINGSAISTSADGIGNAGSVTVQGLAGSAQSMIVDGTGSGIFTKTSGTGAGGLISVNANTITLQNGATLSAATSGTGSVARGGEISLNAPNTLTMANGASITASSSGAADAGSINITATNGLSMQSGSSITTEAGKGAGGGNIKITTSPAATVLVQDSTISASVADGPGGGGNVSIDPQYVILQNGRILARAADGAGGSISIVAGLFLPDATSVVSADSGSGVNGTVTIQSPISQAGGRIQPLGKSPLLSTMMFNQRCAALAGGNFSSFTVAGRDTLPVEPGSWFSTPLALSTANEEKVQQANNEPGPPLLSLRQIAPPGFLTHTFAAESSAGCSS